MLLIICIKTVGKSIIHRVMQALWAIQTVVLHRRFALQKKSQAIISCVRSIRGLTSGLHAIGVVLCLLDSLQGLWSPADTYRIAGCGLSKLRAFNMFSARANGKKVTFNNETGADAFQLQVFVILFEKSKLIPTQIIFHLNVQSREESR